MTTALTQADADKIFEAVFETVTGEVAPLKLRPGHYVLPNPVARAVFVDVDGVTMGGIGRLAGGLEDGPTAAVYAYLDERGPYSGQLRRSA